ncbi:MAG: hypothetical protein FD118_4238, partial [Rhodocyclaceae bacterium]
MLRRFGLVTRRAVAMVPLPFHRYAATRKSPPRANKVTAPKAVPQRRRRTAADGETEVGPKGRHSGQLRGLQRGTIAQIGRDDIPSCRAFLKDHQEIDGTGSCIEGPVGTAPDRNAIIEFDD